MRQYPHYNSIADPKKRQAMQEQEAGRMQVMRNMAEALTEQLAKELMTEAKVSLDHSNDDPRLWEVKVTFDKIDTAIYESWWEFPSANLLATIMLLGGK